MIKEKYTLPSGETSYHLIAEEGKLLRRKLDGWCTKGAWVYYMIHEGKQILPGLDDFEEIDLPEIK